MFQVLKQEGRARRGEFHTVHGVIHTPVFMNVGTAAAIKGAVSTEDFARRWSYPIPITCMSDPVTK